MSDFAPGFLPRPDRGFAAAFAGAAFAPLAPAAAAQAASPRHFAPADRTANPTEGWDPFAATLDAEAELRDPLAAAHAAGFAEGRAQALAERAAAAETQAALAERLAAALERGSHLDRERIAAALRRTVLALVTRMVGDSGVAPALLSARIAAAIERIADESGHALLQLHPEDAAALEGLVPARVALRPDPARPRGSFVLESAATLIEDGPALWLDQLAQAIDQVPVPAPC